MKRLLEHSALVAVLILLLTGTVSFILGINDYRKSILDTAEAEFITRYYPALETVCDEALKGDDDVAEACVGIAFEEAEDVRAAWLYNVETGRISSADGNRYSEKHPEYFYNLMPDGRVVNDTGFNRTVKYRVFDGAQYSYQSIDRYRIIALHDISGYVQEMKETILSAVVLYLAAGAVTAAAIILLDKIKRSKLRHGLTMALLFLWVAGLSANMFLGTYRMYTESKKEFNGIVLSYIDEDVDAVAKMSDDEAEVFCSTYCPDRYSENKNPQLVLAEFYSEAYADGNYILSIKAKDNILDTDTPIAQRVDIEWSGNANELTECIVRSVTIGILALVLYFEWMDSRKRSSAGEQPDKSLRAYQAAVTFQGLSTGIVKAVLVVVLAEIAKGKGVASANAVTATTVLIFLAEPLRYAVSTGSMRKHKSFKRLLVVNSAAMLASMLVCAFSSSLLLYLAGFVIIKVCGESSCSFKNIYTEIKGNSNDASKTISDIVNSYRGGKIAGMIATGIIAGLVSSRMLFLIAAVFTLASLLFFVKCDIEAENPDLSRVDIRQLVSKRDVRMFLILIVVMAGVLEYYFDFVLPLAISSLNYSAGTISFVYLLSSLSKYVFTYAKQRTALSKLKLKNITGAVIYLISEAAVLSVIMLRPSLVPIAFSMVLFGILSTWTFKGNMSSTLFAKSRNTDSRGGLIVLVDTVTESGTFLASTAVGAGMPVALLPVIVIVSPFLYHIYEKTSVRSSADGKEDSA